jgi:hypothetical protein
MTIEEQQTQAEQKAAKAAANKAYYTRLAEFHKKESDHYAEKASACDEIVLVPMASTGKFGGL